MISQSGRMRLIQIAKKIILKANGCSPHRGVASRFLKISENWGVKFSLRRADYITRIFANQRRAWRLGLGPFCFGLFRLTVGDITFHCYITEVAKVILDMIEKQEIEWKGGIFLDSDGPFLKRCKHLMRILEQKLDISFSDTHYANFGLIGSRFVCIDFGCD